MNEKENANRQFHLRRLLASMECRISISRIGDKPVRTKYALVQITDLQSRKIQFMSSLKLPADPRITYTFELLMDGIHILCTGSDLQRTGQTAPYQYSIEHDLGVHERAVLFSRINQRMETSYPLMTKAIESYSSSYVYDHCTPSHYFQTSWA